MLYRYQCYCGSVIERAFSLEHKTPEWKPPLTTACQCGQSAVRIWGAANIGIDDRSDEVKSIGQSISSSSNIEFTANGYPDVERRLRQEQDEIEQIMNEPVTPQEVAAGLQQFEELERERGKPKGYYSGKREEVDVTIKALTADESERKSAVEAQKLTSALKAGIDSASKVSDIEQLAPASTIEIPADKIDALSKSIGVPKVEAGEEITVKRAKRRGAEVLAEEARKAKANR